MKRNPELAKLVTRLPMIVELRGKAIDKITALSMSVQKMNNGNDEVQEFVLEQKVQDLLLEAVYHYAKYLSTKLTSYEALLEEENTKKSKEIVSNKADMTESNDLLKDAFDNGNKVIEETDFTREVPQ